MEYLSLGDLYGYVQSREEQLSESCAQTVVFQVLEGVNFMHDNDFTHRDLKPQVSPMHFINISNLHRTS
jgi:serine/threonine protein kinase